MIDVFNLRQRADEAKTPRSLERLIGFTRARAADMRDIVRWPALAESFEADVAYIQERLMAMRVKQ